MSHYDDYPILNLIKTLEEQYLNPNNTTEGQSLRVLAILQKQPSLVPLVSSYKDAIASAYASPAYEKELTAVCQKMFEDIKKTPHLYILQKPEADIIAQSDERTEELRAAIPIVKEATKTTKELQWKTRRSFVESAVRTWTQKLRTEEREAVTKAVTDRVLDALETSPKSSLSQPVTEAVFEALPNISPRAVEAFAKSDVFKTLTDTTVPIENTIATEVVFSEKPQAAALAFNTVIKESVPPTSPKEFTAVFQNAQSLAEPLAKMTTADALLGALPAQKKTEALRNASKGFFKSISEGGGGVVGMRAFVEDFFVSALGPDIINETIRKSLGKNQKDIATAGFTKSPIGKAYPKATLQQSIQTALVTQQQAIYTKTPFAAKLATNLGAPFFSKSSTSLQLVMWYVVIQGKKLSDDMVPFLLKSAKSPWEETLKLGVEIGVKKGVTTAATKIAGAGTTVGLTAALVPFLGPLAAPVAWFINDFFIGKIVSKITGTIGGALSFLGGGFVRWLTGGPSPYGSKYSWKNDMSVIIPMVLVLFILVSTVFYWIPPMFGLSTVGMQLQNDSTWQIVSLPKESGEGEGSEVETINLAANPQALIASVLRKSRDKDAKRKSDPSTPYCNPLEHPECAADPCVPDPSDPTKCDWPTQCGVISQAPGNTGGTHSAHNLNAIDILTNTCGGHVDVSAFLGGKVIAIVNSFGENDHDPRGGGYGNRVIMEVTDGKGNTFQLWYAHLWNIALYKDKQTGVTRELQVGDVLKKGDAIGKTNDNGLSDIDHLHFEVRSDKGTIGGPTINSILPQKVPDGCYNYGGKPCGITIGNPK